MAKVAADRVERDAIRNDLDVTMLVEAAAGTGKTTNLVKRMVNVVATGRATPATIAAITFTVKAASHLRAQLRDPSPPQSGGEGGRRPDEGAEPRAPQGEGTRRRDPSPPQSGGEGGRRPDEGAETRPPHPREAASRHADPLPASQGEGTRRCEGGRRPDEGAHGWDRAFIGTTHAFCAQLLRERPVEAGLDPDFEELDEPAAIAIASEFWNRWSDTRIAEAREVGLDRKTLRAAFLRIAEHPDVTPVSQHVPRPDLTGAHKKLVAFIDRVAPLMPPDDGHEPDEFEKMMRWLIRRRRTRDLTDPFEQFSLLDEGDHASRKPVQKRWPDKAIAKQLGIDYADLVNTTIRPAVQQWREHVHGIAIDLLRPAARAFAEERRRNGTLTFADLLVCARDLLRDHPNVRRYFQKRFTHVFVDEFQDTDPVQAEVLMFLTGDDAFERNWRKLRPRPGSLFIVGDPKQSIYRFRRADITTYLDVKKLIERSGGRIVKLSTNFRSMPAICAYVNDVFPSLFDPRDVAKGRQAEHVDLEAFHDGDSSVLSLETPDDRKLDVMACAEAEVVGKWIGDKVEKGELQWSDVMLVSWYRPRLRCYARIFETLGIPYEVTGSKAFVEFEELQRVMPLLRAVATPDDEVAIVAFLAGPLCGVDDDALYRFRMAGGRFSPFSGVLEGTDPRIERGLRIIRESIDDAREHPPAAAIARIFDRVGVLALSASGERPGTRSGNLMLALSIARELSAAGESLASIVEDFGELLEVKPDSIEELDIDPKRENAVRLMNLHQVKGLEAPVVFLIDPSDAYEFDIDLHVDRSGDESLGYFAIKRNKKTIGLPRGWDAFEQTEEDFQRTERARLLYVAATRAMMMLVVGFRTSQGKVKGAWSQLASRIKNKLLCSDARPRASTAAESAAATPLPDIAAQFEAARARSYSVLPITKIAHGSFAELVKAEEGLGKGTSWGRVLHRLFEAMLRDETLDIRLYAANLLKDEERDPVELDEVMRVIDAVRGSALWSRVKAADERYVEIPFALNVPRRDVGIDEDGETLLHGTIDLVFRERDRWFIVDYKSDSTAGRIDALVDYYAPQVRYYARFWTQLTDASASAGLFFVDGCIEKWVM